MNFDLAGYGTKGFKLTHCYKGHDFTPETTGYYGKVRYCRVCSVARLRGNRHAKRIGLTD